MARKLKFGEPCRECGEIPRDGKPKEYTAAEVCDIVDAERDRAIAALNDLLRAFDDLDDLDDKELEIEGLEKSRMLGRADGVNDAIAAVQAVKQVVPVAVEKFGATEMKERVGLAQAVSAIRQATGVKE